MRAVLDLFYPLCLLVSVFLFCNSTSLLYAYSTCNYNFKITPLFFLKMSIFQFSDLTKTLIKKIRGKCLK